MKFLTFFGFFIILIQATFIPNFAIAQIESEFAKEDFREGFIRGLRNEANIRKKITPFGLGDRKTDVLVRHYKALVNDDAVAKRIFDEFLATGMLNDFRNNPRLNREDTERIESLGYALFEMLGVKGLRRLDYEDQRIYLVAIQKMYGVMPPKMCKALMMGDLSSHKDMTAFGVFMIKGMSLAETDNYLRVYRKAAIAEARNYPSVRTLTLNQQEIAEDTFAKVLVENLGKHPRGERLAQAMIEFTSATDQEVCETAELVMKSMLGMSGVVAEWYVRSFIDSVQ